MKGRAQIARTVKVPDSLRVGRAERAPELGPRIVFFSGGSALRPLSRVLKRYTHNSTHLITPFDSGGSSAEIRKAFHMLSIGDLRSRLVALAEESVRGNPDIYRLFCHRLSATASQRDLRTDLQRLVNAEHPLVLAVPQPMRHIIRTHLTFFADHMPDDFDLQGANIGNLMLTGAYLSQRRDMNSTLFLFSKLLEVRATVRPTAECDAHLAAVLSNGRRVNGQHMMTGKQVAPLEAPIRDFFLVDSIHGAQPTTVSASEEVLRLIRKADLICFPMGSFYTSILANLLPDGVAQAVAEADCPKLYVPNTGHDPEQVGMSIRDCVMKLLEMLQSPLSSSPQPRLLTHVLLDAEHGQYEGNVDLNALEALGCQVLDVDLRSDDASGGHSAQELAKVLISLGQ